MKIYKTKSGSVYHVDGDMVRRIERSARSDSERVSVEWRQAESITVRGVGFPIEIIWGLGADEHSDNGKTLLIGLDDGVEQTRLRMTVTTPVVEMIEVDDGREP